MTNILLIEDNPDEIQETTERLEANGYNVIPVDRAIDVHSTLQDYQVNRGAEHHFAVAIVDLKLGPGEERAGFGAIREVNAFPHIQVIVHTGTGSEEKASSSTALRVFRYLVKGAVVEGISAAQVLLDAVRDAEKRHQNEVALERELIRIEESFSSLEKRLTAGGTDIRNDTDCTAERGALNLAFQQLRELFDR